jgi:uncharacterized protein (TIGR03435 family)
MFELLTEQHIGRIRRKRGTMNLMRKLASIFLCGIILFVPLIFGQSDAVRVAGGENAEDVPSHQIEFEITSIRPSGPGSGTTLQFTPEGLKESNFPLSALLQIAYHLSYLDGTIVGAPEWVRTDRFDIQAKVAESDLPEWGKLIQDQSERSQEFRLVAMQILMADRFALKVHRETRQGSVYALVIAKSGLKLKDAEPDDAPSLTMRRSGHVSVRAAQIAAIVPFITQIIGRPVVDETGLTSKYDFTLDWTPDQVASPAGVSAESEASGPSIFTAIQEQLGLKLESQKGPVEVLVIDHIEKPSPN